MATNQPTCVGASRSRWLVVIGVCGLLALCALLPCGLSGASKLDPQAKVPFRAARAPTGDFIAWREHIVDDSAVAGERVLGADGLAWADLDGDGIPDVVAVHEDSSHVRAVFGPRTRGELFRPGWSGSITLGRGNLVGAAEDVTTGDFDADGRTDVAVACERGHVVVFFGPAMPRDAHSWQATVISVTVGRGSWIRVQAVDLDRDGDDELLAVNKGRREVSLLDVDPSMARQPGRWRELVLWRCRTPINARAIDLDCDGDLDVVASSRGERRIVWIEARDDQWLAHPLYAGTDPPSEGFMMEFADLNGDGLPDIVTEEDHGGRVFWMEQRPGREWAIHLIGTIDPDHATGLALADINGDHRLDLMVGGYSAGPRLREPESIKVSDRCGRLAWFEHPDDPRNAWPRHDISRRRRGMFDMFVPCDLDSDGLVDFLTTRGNSGTLDGVVWFQQVRLPHPGPAFRPARSQDSQEVPLP